MSVKINFYHASSCNSSALIFHCFHKIQTFYHFNSNPLIKHCMACNSTCTTIGSYHLISPCWDRNQPCKEEQTTEEGRVQLISGSPSWSQQLSKNIEGNGKWKVKAQISDRQSITMLRERVPFTVPLYRTYLQWDLLVESAPLYSLHVFLPISWIRWSLPTLSMISVIQWKCKTFFIAIFPF